MQEGIINKGNGRHLSKYYRHEPIDKSDCRVKNKSRIEYMKTNI